MKPNESAMSKRRKTKKSQPLKGPRSAPPAAAPDLAELYQQAQGYAEQGQGDEARRRYDQLARAGGDARLRALVQNDQAALSAQAGDFAVAREGFCSALALDPECAPARLNLALLAADGLAPTSQGVPEKHSAAAPPVRNGQGPIKIAILSFLFNWPSTGGGIVHTVELAAFLAQAGYEVRHFHARYPGWGIGRAEGLSLPTQALEFDDASWNVPAIQERFRRAVDAFGPDYVLVTDCWNFKPHLALAMRGYPTLLRFQALECLCPLNNVRLLCDGPGQFSQCPRQQLATPEHCRRCLAERGHHSGSLHQADRELAGVGTPEYDRALHQALQEAEAVLVLNPFTEAMLSPYARRVVVVPWGMDPARFPAPTPEGSAGGQRKGKAVIFQAGLPEEAMKGYAVLHAACEKLWQKRRDFELVVTGEPAGQVDAFTRFTGWASQADLPELYRAADIVAVPTVAQEGLSRTSVEAMAAGRPVVASRIGGLPFTVADGATGLLCAPGDIADLAYRLETLLDDPSLRRRLGQAGRQRFAAEFTWPIVVERHYRPLLVPRPSASSRS